MNCLQGPIGASHTVRISLLGDNSHDTSSLIFSQNKGKGRSQNLSSIAMVIGVLMIELLEIIIFLFSAFLFSISIFML